jgi:carbonic anhydrase
LHEGPREYSVPFAWERSKKEPLARTRTFVSELFKDNSEYMGKGRKFFREFADAQTPRATVVTCSDSRVHTTAFDATPENDDFMIRNIGNQVGNTLGSVEYGIEHLGTPVLLILGHTGCGAVKAAMGDISTLPEPVRKELEPLDIVAPKVGTAERIAWLEGVVDNVHDQVAVALTHFGGRVQTGQLTVIGAVYDFRGDMDQGHGKLSVVNVNGSRDTERLNSFMQAVADDSAKLSEKGEGDHEEIDLAEEVRRHIPPVRGRKRPVESLVDTESFGDSASPKHDDLEVLRRAAWPAP